MNKVLQPQIYKWVRFYIDMLDTGEQYTCTGAYNPNIKATK